MARRERTTGLPRHQRRPRSEKERRFLGVRVDEGSLRWTILGALSVLVLVVVGVFAYRWYHENYIRPEKVILQVDTAEVKLGYYADRLYQFLVQNPTQGGSTIAQSLLRQLENEEVVVLYAESRGIDLSASAVTIFIAERLGVSPNTSNYDRAYRDALRTTGWSDSTYRRVARYSLAERELATLFQGAVPETGEMLNFRAVVVVSEVAAQTVIDRVDAGGDLGTIAQLESLDLTSRQNDGLIENQPPELLQVALAEALAESETGVLLGPLQIGSNWWVLRLESRNPAGEYTETQRRQLANVALDEALEEFRATLTIRQDFNTTSDYQWAIDHTTVVQTGLP